ncbi:uncharacterized protein CG4449 [Daktulosphaira vitifoliae]|uniref:uncharacterized protein CG4449 n=1 Tax=Daktulosphaira vitifoliae TaxID=58002 RepID=UPI0021A9F108|nr:uncharacterized protein CG4449 [Daktulosphaira vitifoliae]
MDFNDDPFDFASQFRKLQTEHNKKKVLSTIDSNISKKDSSSILPVKKPVPQIILDDQELVPSASINDPECPDIQYNKVQLRNKRKNDSQSSQKINGPIICIGDFDDGYNIPSPKMPRVITLDEENIVVDEKNFQDSEDSFDVINRIVNVKVFWRKIRTYRFPIRMFQSFESIYQHFAELENINKSHVYLELNKKPVSSSDTPNSINYKITDFIDGEIEFYKSLDERSTIKYNEELSENEVQFRVMQKDVKHPIFLSMKKVETMVILYIKLSEKLGLDMDSFTLEFDGEKIKKTDTMDSLELDGGECFELYKKN